MNYTLTQAGIEYEGHNYPFIKPEGFDEWLKTKQDAFIQGVLYVYTAPPTKPTPQPIFEEILL
jgi:hypothetical protein